MTKQVVEALAAMENCVYYSGPKQLAPATFEDPCIGSYDENKVRCAQCKNGAARIFVEANFEDDGSSFKFIGCGAIRTPERTATGRYEFLDPFAPDFFEQTASEKFQCFLDPFYDTLVDDET